MAYRYEFPQASPCSNVAIYTRSGNDIELLVTTRDPSVGSGFSMGAGGFDEVKHAFGTAGKMLDGREQTYREMYEELGEGLKEIIPYEDFKKRVRYVWDGMIESKAFYRDGIRGALKQAWDRVTGKAPSVQKVIMRSLEVSKAEMDAIMLLPETSEQKGKALKRFTLNDDPKAAIDSSVLDQVLKGFRYPHEVEGAKMLFERLEHGAKCDRMNSARLHP